MTSRRFFLQASLGAGLLAAAGRGASQSGMRILVLGGTGFIGPHRPTGPSDLAM